MQCYSAVRRQEMLSLATASMKLEGIRLSEISHTEEDKYCVTSPVCET